MVFYVLLLLFNLFRSPEGPFDLFFVWFRCMGKKEKLYVGTNGCENSAQG